MIAREGSVLDVFDPTLLVAVTLALFGILFGARNLDFTKQQTGLMTAVAVESVVKLLAFLAGRRLRHVGALRRASAISSGGSPRTRTGRVCSSSTGRRPPPTRGGRRCW